MQEQTIKIPQAELDQVNEWLMLDESIPDTGRDEVVKTYTANFGNGIEADIKVCNSESGPYVDPVLFENGCEIAVGEVDDALDGEYYFHITQEETYKVVIEAE